MDLVTQTVLGAAVGEVVLGRKAGNKAIMWGAVGGLIPDLDVLVSPFFSEVDGLFVHRGFSHSLIFAFLIAPLLGWLIHHIHKKKMDISWREWTVLIFWAAFTHPVLDYFTTYGTGALLPFHNYRVEFSTIAIVDVFYTLPFILVLLVIPFINRTAKIRRKLIVGMFSITSLYLLGTVVNKQHVNNAFEKAFSQNQIPYERYRTSPLPLSNFLWMGLAETDSGYHIGLYSNFDTHIPDEFIFVPRNKALLNEFSDYKDLNQLIHFTKGYYHVNKDQNGLYLADLRFGKMGINENSEFVFKFYLKHKDETLIIQQSRESRSIENDILSNYIDRIMGIKPKRTVNIISY
ncbi:metal-dependent hydrolase [Marinilabilia salmonicolor]|jgi:inner membrane protein|uniref:Inner membrane protein n=1 Tax=Marinilabilia salmonicolor TaxID=989 RepID=A0A368UP08_9BACT|nr:metal-dependent hydrolase [Marinilabilia salmonicolor]RCW26097.1 inner membrane protein [Marinilabilia salmonicolor]